MPDPDDLLVTLQSLPTPECYRVALSGGLDSQVLLHLLAGLGERLAAPLHAVHVHHGLQAGADEWQAACEQTCHDLDIPLQVLRLALQVRPGESLEAQARKARYAAIAGLMQGQDMLLTAQHRDDQAETLLLQLLRGAGVDGLSAMPVCRPWAGGWHARPLLDYSREQLAAYARARRLDWVEDPSNQDLRFERNFLRHRVFPLLRQRWPAAGAAMARSAGLLGEARARLEAVDARQLQVCRGRPGQLLIRPLLDLSREQRAAVVRLWLREQGATTPPLRRMRGIENMLHLGPDSQPEVCWADHCVRRYRDRLWLLPRVLPAAPGGVLEWSVSDPATATLVLPPGLGELTLRQAERGLPQYLWREGRVDIAWRDAGQVCRIPGRQGGRSLRKVFQELGVPAWQRDYVPLLRIDGQLVALADYCLCADVQVHPAQDPDSSLMLPEWRRPAWLQAAMGSAGEAFRPDH